MSDHLQQATTEREVLVNTGKGGTGIGSFLRETVDNIKGIDAERAKQERLVKLESRIDEVYMYKLVPLFGMVLVIACGNGSLNYISSSMFHTAKS